MADDDERPRAHDWLPTPDGQRLYWEEWGAPDGVPALRLHGGPGGTLGRGDYRHRFDAERTRIIGMEQRGCGRSTPHAADPATSLADNTTAHLVADIEALRVHLGIDRWLLDGVSWGSTLALAYALTHPRRVLGIVLSAVTTTGRAEIDWITEGVGSVYPEAWDRFAGHAERAGIGYRRGRGRLVTAYDRLFASPDPAVRDAASRAWARWEDVHISIGAGGYRRDPRWDDDRFRWAFTRLAAHYWSHDGFCDPPLLTRAGELAGIPGVLVHGRADVSGPAVTAWRLHRGWPGSRLVVVESGGHGGGSVAEQAKAAHRRLLRQVAG